MTALHCMLHQFATNRDEDDVINHCIAYGLSTANKIERFWRELHHRMETFFKEQLSELLNNGDYDQTCELDRLVKELLF